MAGAPVDFGGMVLPNPNNIKPMADTDQPAGAPTQLQGATLSNGVYYGGSKMDTSDPASAQIIPGMMRAAAAKSATPGKDIAALFADKEFQGFSPANKREALSRATGDDSLRDLSDAETLQLVSRATARIRSTRPDLIPPPGVPRPQVNMQQSALGTTDTSDPSIPQFGGMHGGSYDIAFRDPQGQISPQTINAEALGGSAGIAVGAGGKALGSATAVKAVSEMAKDHPVAASLVKKAIVGLAGAEAYKHGKWLMDILP